MAKLTKYKHLKVLHFDKTKLSNKSTPVEITLFVIDQFDTDLDISNVKNVKLLQILKHNSFLYSNRRDIQDKTKQLTKDLTYKEIMPVLRITNVFSSEDCEFLSLIIPTNRDEKGLMINFILYQFICWEAAREATNDCSGGDILLHSINYTIKIIRTQGIERLFIIILEKYIKSSNFTPNISLVDEIFSFYKESTIFANEYSSLFTSIVSKFYSQTFPDRVLFRQKFLALISEKKDTIGKPTIDFIISCFMPDFILMNSDSYDIFSGICDLLDPSKVMDVIQQLSDILVYSIRGSNVTIKKNSNYKNYDFRLIKMEFNFKQINALDEKFTVNNTDFNTEINYASPIFNSSLDSKINIFIKMIIRSKIHISECISYLRSIIGISTTESTDHMVETLYLEICYKILQYNATFSSLYTTFVKSFILKEEFFVDENRNFRNMVYKLIFQDDNALVLLTKQAAHSPLMFKEVMSLFAANFCNSQETLTKKQSLLHRDIVTGFSNLLYLVIQREQGIIEITKSCLTSLHFLLKNQKVTEFLFNDSSFNYMMISFSIQENLREFVFNEICSNLSDLHQNLLLSIFNLLDIVKIQMNETVCQQYMIDFLEFLARIIALNDDYKKKFTTFCPTLLDFVKIPYKNDLFKVFFVKLLNFMSLFPNLLTINMFELQILSLSVQNLFGKVFDRNLTMSLFNFLTANSNEIYQPSVATIIMRNYTDIESTILIGKEILRLVKFSEQNCLQLHNAEFDIFILEVLTSIWEDDKIDDNYFNLLMDIFINIAIKVSSPVIVQKFISFLCPNDNLVVSKHFYEAVLTLKKFFKYQKNFPPVSKQKLPKKLKLNRNLTFIFKSNFQKVKNDLVICEVIDKMKTAISLYINNSALFVKTITDEKTSNQQITSQNISDFSVTFSIEIGRLILVFLFNGLHTTLRTSIIPNEETKLLFYHNNLINCNCNFIRYFLLLCDDDDLIDRTLKNDNDVFMEIHESKDLVVFSNQIIKSQQFLLENFPNLLISKVKLDILIPLFLFPDMKINDKRIEEDKSSDESNEEIIPQTNTIDSQIVPNNDQILDDFQVSEEEKSNDITVDLADRSILNDDKSNDVSNDSQIIEEISNEDEIDNSTKNKDSLLIHPSNSSQINNENQVNNVKINENKEEKGKIQAEKQKFEKIQDENEKVDEKKEENEVKSNDNKDLDQENKIKNQKSQQENQVKNEEKVEKQPNESQTKENEGKQLNKDETKDQTNKNEENPVQEKEINKENVSPVKSDENHDKIRNKEESFDESGVYTEEVSETRSSHFGDIDTQPKRMRRRRFHREEKPVKKEIGNVYQIAISLLEKAIETGYYAEPNFAESGSFAMINNILTKHKQFLNFDVYLMFYHFFEKLQTTELQSQMITNIILNIELWCSSESSFKIFDHWLNIFVVRNMSLVTTIISFLSFFSSICIVYYKTEVESSILPYQETKNSSKKILYQILVEMSPFSFTFDDLQHITDYVLTCKNESLCLDIIDMIKKISLLKNSPFQKFCKNSNFLAVFYKYMSTNNGKIIAGICDILIYLLSKYSNSITITITMFSFLSHLDDRVFDMNLYDCFSNYLFTNNGCFLPVLCFLSQKIGHKASVRTIELLTQQKVTFDFTYWPIFPLSIIKYLQMTDIKQLLSYLIDVYDDWIYLYTLVSIVGHVSLPSDFLEPIFLNSMYEKLYKKGDNVEIREINYFAFISLHFLFMRNQCYNNMALLCKIQSEIGQIVTDIECVTNCFQIEFPTKRAENTKTVSDYLTLFSVDESIINKVKFGVRFDQNGDWIDEDLAKKICKILLKKQTDLALIFILLTSTLMIGKEVGFFTETIQNIKLQDKINEIVENLINLSHIKMKVKNSNYNFNISKSDKNFNHSIQKSFEAYDMIVKIFTSFPFKVKSVGDEISDIWMKSEQFLVDILVSSVSKAKKVDFIENYKNQLAKELENNHKMWRHKWGYMTLEKSAWEKAVPLHRHFMRDKTLCYAMCPFKLKPNWEFNDHKEASEARLDTSKMENTKNYFRKDSWTKISPKKFNENEASLFTTKIFIIKITRNFSALLSLHKSDMTIKYDDEQRSIKTIYYNTIVGIEKQCHLHLPTAIEIFLENGHQIFINFESPEVRATSLKYLTQRLKSFVYRPFSDQLIEKTTKWVQGQISNFEYLIYLNYLSGRSFINPCQYPIMPWVIDDYDSQELDLSDKKTFRDLSKPVGALNEERLEFLKNNISELSGDSFLYENGMGCSLTLFGMMIRMEPFTTMHIVLQSGKFDIAERLFASIKNLHQSSLHDQNDYKELIPEFFFLPDIFLNKNNFNLGTINHDKNDDVILPPWSHNNPVEFVYKNRKALESDFVSKNLNNWIDLVFGYKQKGEESRKCDNTFSPYLYDDIWTNENLNDPVKKSEIEASKMFLGQIPHQIFTSPHPRRNPQTVKTNPIKFDSGSTNLLFVKVCQEKSNVFSFYTISKNLEFSNNVCVFDGDQVQTDLRKFKKIDMNDTDVTFIYLQSNLYLVNTKKSCFVLETDNLQNYLTEFSSPLQCQSVDSNYFTTLNSNSILSVYKTDKLGSCVSQTPFHRDIGRAICLSKIFRVVVVGSRDGGVVVHSLDTGNSVFVIELSLCSILSIVVTPSWGFIVVYLTRTVDNKIVHCLNVHTINGLFVKEEIFPSKIEMMTAFKSPDGFDYLAVSSTNGLVFISDVFELKFEKIFYKMMSSALFMEYSQKSQALMLFSETGRFLLLHVDFNNI
ncbi:Beige/BEACH domain containing protein [Trichomonas vaginalis G3]|uniref:Beige/BEACH domain containing protein n=1 Tax=Trichomonas vaginalis (strain ATCC PRA-98 / G3) TaxID=412133 RepID=A2D998_TRIV3|nr:beige/BEACH-related family [Trichomonas vaginalis G3]EAY23124.1 Beige/BEACH domain containing protein [Trichomonas vaginalis G3]KAI5513823.1 beige/BEACH-related family [Trichomonas vaginalis G3]|eukprot:XP_001584110.1 Beige/BEACH domain containing protein [Trichomonas vaginalis G3]